ncbi:hypothetical protein ACJRO7_034303 [Eucalyptus globulus]|uniref:Cysteine-rich receptor-like protein kinase 10 n=1 Tax=Eucalyptus globulus TaxID=34317 RepID=A0ABD3JCD3_EUCGL
MKSCFAVSLSLSFFFIIRIFITEATPNYLFHACPNTTLFTPNSTYQSNLDALLSSLAFAASKSTNGFANATAGQNPPDQVYGLFLCRGDLNTTTCSDCVATGKQEILKRCPNQQVSVIWYDECMLRYSNQSTFSVMEREPLHVMSNTENANDSTRFMEVLLETLGDVIKKAFAGWSGKKVAAAEANFTSLQKLYAFAQCTPDLTAWDCNKCLQNANGYLVEGKQGGRTLTPSCIVMYESYPFYNASALPVSAPPPPPPPPAPVIGPKGKSNKSTVTAIAITVSIGDVLVLLFLTCFLLRGKKTDEVVGGNSGANELTTVESLQFDLATIQVATNDFSSKNKLGEGGFGEVFQGRLLDGQQIAVKRLSRSSRQGDEEFKNEVLLVAKLQHRNLVRLLGFCLEGEEKLLVYEFVPNKSLDYFLFDPQKGGQLNWSLRYKIIYGIARGMLYLHEDSRLRIIHRDLKCSNILLDSEMNPKISDFGMARIFGVNQTQASTTKIMGTFGYMSPEYAMHGEFSVKSDVYSFGILLIEIICGKKNNFYHQLDGGEYLASYIWNKWRDGTPLKVLDPAIMDSYSRDEFLRCLHIGLLCIQEDPAIRPIMATVVHMLSSNYLNLSSPRRPAFFIRSRLGGLSIPMKELGSNQSTGRNMPLSTNDMSVTELYPR